jgi:serine/threonine-protein kinase
MSQLTDTTMASQNMVERPLPNRHLGQAASVFSSPSEARDFFTHQATDWTACAGRALTAYFARADKTQHYTLGTPALRGDLLTLTFASAQRQCQRAIGLRAEVIVDVRACGPAVHSEAATVANDVLAKIS